MARPVIAPSLFREALSTAAAVFAAEGRTWWIQDGSLLGAVRHGGPIPGDTDVDVGMPAPEFGWSLVDRFVKAGFKVERIFGSPADGLEVRMVYGELHFDIFLLYERGELRYCCGYHKNFMLDYVVEPFSLASITYLGLEVPCPSPPERYLEAAYGPDWRIPVKSWHYAFSPKNVSVRGSRGRHLQYRWRRGRWAFRVGRKRLQRLLIPSRAG